jgi:vitamin B12 transporter
VSYRIALFPFPVVMAAAFAVPATVLKAEEASSKNLNPIIVSASRLETRESDVASSVTVISEEEIRAGHYTTVVQALRKVPGLDLVQTGGPGGNVAAFLRGANSEHTLVMLDGIELNNPASPNRAYNLANLTLENVERIEVIRGPQSMLYGSDAMGGVINIITKRAEKGSRVSVRSEAGAYQTFNQVASVALSDDRYDSSTAVTRQDIGGISSANARDGNVENDGYENTSVTNSSRFSATKASELKTTTRYTRSHASLDNNGGARGDDPNRFLFNDEFFSRGEISNRSLSGALVTSAWASYSHHYLKDYNNPDERSPETIRSSYGGDLFDFGGKAAWSPQKWFSGVVGAETQRERADSSYYSAGLYDPYRDELLGQRARTNSFYAESRVSYNDVAFIDGGVRHDDHSIFGGRTTFRVAPAVLLAPETKVRGSIGTGFKAPSLVQLYSSYGNADLAAERSVGWDVGVDQQLFAKEVTVSVTYFNNSFENLISFDPATFVLENIKDARTSGLEGAVTAALSKSVTTKMSYTYTDTEDQATNEALLRRPKNKGTVGLTYAPTERFTAGVQLRLVSSRFDNDFSSWEPSRTTLGGYSLLDINAAYRISETLTVFTRVDNLLDKEYEEVFGYGTMGAAAYGGVSITM